jgi:MbtH protein
MTDSPFDDTSGTYLVLVNAYNHHSLWPARFPVPDGWTTVYGQGPRNACKDYIDAHWTPVAADPAQRPAPE